MSIYAGQGQNLPVKSLRVPVTPVFRNKLTGFFLLILLLSGCANYGTPKNVVIPDPREAEKYSLQDWQEGHSSTDISFSLTFSGGGFGRQFTLGKQVFQAYGQVGYNVTRPDGASTWRAIAVLDLIF